MLDGGFQIRALKLIYMTLKEAEGFYAVHRERPFFPGLTELCRADLAQSWFWKGRRCESMARSNGATDLRKQMPARFAKSRSISR